MIDFTLYPLHMKNTSFYQQLSRSTLLLRMAWRSNLRSTAAVILLLTLSCGLYLSAASAQVQAELWIKDDPSDDGSEPSATQTPFESPDIWIQKWEFDEGVITSPGMPGYDPRPYYNPDPTDDAGYDPQWVKDRQDQHPQHIPTGYSMPVWVYVKVRNRGNAPSDGTEVLRVYWAKASTGLNWPTSWTGQAGHGNLVTPGGDCGTDELYLGDEITKPRKNASTLSAFEIQRLQEAYRDINEIKAYSDGVSLWHKQDEIHQATHVHSSPSFLPWHREIVNRFENILREVHPEVKLPYWDWVTDPTQANGGTPLLGTDPEGDDVDDFMGMALDRVAATGYGSSDFWKSFDLNYYCSDGPNDKADWFEGLRASRGDAGCTDDRPPPCDGSAAFADPVHLLSRDCVGGDPTELPWEMEQDIDVITNSLSTEEPDEFQAEYLGFWQNLSGWNHLNGHQYVGMGSGVFEEQGNILDPHTSFQDPFVFIIHSEVDRLFAKWQRYYAADANHTANNQFLRRLIPFDPITLFDVYGDERNTGIEEIEECDDGGDWGIQNTLEPWAGASMENTIPVFPWTALPPEGRIVAKTSIDPTVVTPPIYDDAPLTIPVLAPGESVIMQVPWFPPDPKVASCTGNEGHYCLLARIERVPTYPFGMHSAEATNLPRNVRNNNNIAWKNIQIMPGDPGETPNVPPPPPPPCADDPCMGIGEVIVHNVDPMQTVNTKLVFTGVTDMELDSVGIIDSIIVDLGTDLFDLWAAGGYQGDGVSESPCDSNTIVVEPTGGWIGNILLSGDQMETINLAAIPSSTDSLLPYQFHLLQYKAATLVEEVDTLIGGETFRGDCYEAWEAAPPPGDTGIGGPAEKRAAPNVVSLSRLQPHFVMTVNPNPFTNEISLKVNLDAEALLRVDVYDVLGNSIYGKGHRLERSGEHHVMLGASNWPSGTYYVRVSAPWGEVQTLKLMKE